MSSVLKISEAASLALHTMVYLAANRGKSISNKDIASVLDVSETHLSKVLQRLAKFGLVKSVRGPKGGFKLGKGDSDISLLEVYEAIDSALEPDDCLLGSHICGGDECILGDLIGVLNNRVKDYLSKTRLADLTNVYGGINAKT